MKKAYDRERASRLVPLLEAICQEVAERNHRIRILERRVEQLGAEEQAGAEGLELKAQLATHKREVRLAMRELDHLGCVVDQEHPSTICIPGRDGNLDCGFRWNAVDGSIHRVALDETSVR